LERFVAWEVQTHHIFLKNIHVKSLYKTIEKKNPKKPMLFCPEIFIAFLGSFSAWEVKNTIKIRGVEKTRLWTFFKVPG
jgi:hypothetical protein